MSRTTGTLVICPTPLGNLGDVTKRTLDALRTCDVVCCEDTRVTGKLLAAFGIEKRLERVDEAQIAHKLPCLLERLQAGQTIAYASDAGMPGVSDPGQRLVDAALSAGIDVDVLPGPTAVATAYVASGFLTPSFFFGAFFPRKDGERTRLLESLKSLDAALIFYESPLRLVSALRSMEEVMPYRRVAVCRELTKVHQEVVRGPLPHVRAEFEKRQAQGPIKGEIVIVLDAPNEDEAAADEAQAHASAHERAQELLTSGELSKKDVVRALKDEFGLSRNEAYDLVHGI